MEEEMEGKDLAQEEKVKAFIEELKGLIKQSQESENSTISSNNYEVSFNEETKTYSVKFSGTGILLAQESESGFDVYPEAIYKYKKLIEQAQKDGIATLDKPAGLVESEELEEFLEKQEELKEEQAGEKEETASEEEIEEEKDDEKPELEDKKEKKENKENNEGDKPKNVGTTRDPKGIEIRGDREIDEMQTFAGAIKREYPEIGGITKIFIAQDENDINSYKLIVQDQKGIYKEIPLKATEGKDPMQEDVTTIDNDGNNSTQKKPKQILKINNRSMIMIFNGGRTDTEVHIGNRSDGDNYTSTKISSADNQNGLKDPNKEVRDQVSTTKDAQENGDNVERAYAVMINFEKQGLPDEVNPTKDESGIESEELKDFPTALVQNVKKGLKELFQERNINITDEAIDKIAKSVTEGKDFDDAVLEGMQIEENAGRIPPGSAERAAQEAVESIEDDSDAENEGEREEEREEEDPRAPRR